MAKHEEVALAPYSGSRNDKDPRNSSSAEVVSCEEGDGHEAFSVVSRERDSSCRHYRTCCSAENCNKGESKNSQIALP